MLKAGIDLDGVIGNVSYSLINYINGIYWTDFTIDNITDYEVDKWFSGMTSQEAKSMFKNPGFYMNMPPLSKAIESINLLKYDGWWVDIVTARDWSCLSVTVDWLRDEALEFDRLSFVEPDQKTNYARDEQFDIFVEDNPNTVNQLVDVVPLVYLIDAPYNKNVNNGIMRIKNLGDMLDSLRILGIYE